MATPLDESGHAAGFILSEANGQRSRENVTLEGSAGTVKAGRVLGIIDTGSDTDLYAPFDPAVNDGRDDAKAISLNEVANSASTQEIAVIRRDAEVNGDELVWPDGISDNDKNTAIAELATQGIIVR
jgi:hypothetical protein